MHAVPCRAVMHACEVAGVFVSRALPRIMNHAHGFTSRAEEIHVLRQSNSAWPCVCVVTPILGAHLGSRLGQAQAPTQVQQHQAAEAIAVERFRTSTCGRDGQPCMTRWSPPHASMRQWRASTCRLPPSSNPLPGTVLRHGTALLCSTWLR